MKAVRSLTTALAIAILVAGSSMAAQGQNAPDPHHPSNGGTAQPGSPAAPIPVQEGQPGVMGMMPMTQMMNMMAQGCIAMSGMKMGPMDQAGMVMVDHVEGRIAFLRAELMITEEQAGAWSEMEEALRGNATRLKEARNVIMGAASSPQTLEQRLENQVRWLSARLEGTRAIKSALSHLYLALSPEQKKAADELMGAHMGLLPTSTMPMEMMQTGGAMP